MSETPESDENRSEQADPENSETDESRHLSELEDGCGCAEVWEHLSEHRRTTDD